MTNNETKKAAILRLNTEHPDWDAADITEAIYGNSYAITEFRYTQEVLRDDNRTVGAGKDMGLARLTNGYVAAVNDSALLGEIERATKAWGDIYYRDAEAVETMEDGIKKLERANALYNELYNMVEDSAVTLIAYLVNIDGKGEEVAAVCSRPDTEALIEEWLTEMFSVANEAYLFFVEQSMGSIEDIRKDLAEAKTAAKAQASDDSGVYGSGEFTLFAGTSYQGNFSSMEEAQAEAEVLRQHIPGPFVVQTKTSREAV